MSIVIVLTFGHTYDTSSDYPMTKEQASLYLKILDSCPIPLKIRTYEDYRQQFVSKIIKKYNTNEEKFAGKYTVGQYIYGYKVKGWPNNFIFLMARPNPHEMMGTYFHELGHHKCKIKKCRSKKKHMSEYHAIINELELSMQYDFCEVLKVTFKKFDCWIDGYPLHKKYAEGVLAIQQTELWDRVKKYASQHNINVPVYHKLKTTRKSNAVIIKISQ